MKNMIHVVPGYQTNPEGDMLGMRVFFEFIKENFLGTDFYAVAWNKMDTPTIIKKWSDKRNILVSHSYGGAGCKRTLEILKATVPNMIFDCAIWLDPVPRWLWGQFPLLGWNCPTNILQSNVFYQENFPPYGLPFKKRTDVRQWDVSHWENGLFHSDIPGAAMVQRAMTEIISPLLTT